MEVRLLCRGAKRLRLSALCSQPPQPVPRRRYATKLPEQAISTGGFYDILLEDPFPTVKDATEKPTPPPKSLPESVPRSAKDEIADKARAVFGSKAETAAQRKMEKEQKSVLQYGVLVPPKPEEPDNCCMSGCVNCVWDLYRDEFEEYAMAKKEADHTKQLQMRRMQQDTVAGGAGVAGSMDDDGGGSEANWSTGPDTDMASDDLFKNVPVGIREFMKQEKRLKERHAARGEPIVAPDALSENLPWYRS